MPDRRLAVIRADASSATGGGHVVRCMALAAALQRAGWRTIFATNADAGRMFPAIAAEPGAWCALEQPDDSDELMRKMGRPCELLVLDHYGLGASYATPCRPWARKILVIDDLADRDHDCDMLVDTGLAHSATDYAVRVSAGTKLLLGPRYGLLRSSFASQRPASLARRPHAQGIRRVLVAMGMTDTAGLLPMVARAVLHALPGSQVVVLAGGEAQTLKALRDLAEERPGRLELRIDEVDPAPAMASCDLAVSAAGSTVWELFCLGVPVCIVTVADNQKPNAERLREQRVVDYLGPARDMDENWLADHLDRLCRDSEYGRMAERAALVCDGHGAERIVEEIGRAN